MNDKTLWLSHCHPSHFAPPIGTEDAPSAASRLHHFKRHFFWGGNFGTEISAESQPGVEGLEDS